ncbi:MAG: hypothetical protein AAF485_21750 [Chloroflexota bacterium]
MLRNTATIDLNRREANIRNLTKAIRDSGESDSGDEPVLAG